MTAFSKDGLARLEEILKAHVAEGSAPGLVALVAKADQTHVFPVGAMTVEGKPPIRRDTIFRIASMTKPTTAVAAMMLAEDGTLELDEPIDRLAPELADRRVLKRIDGPLDETEPAKRAITPADVLTFRLGWGFVFSDSYPTVKATAGLPGFGMPNPGLAVTPDQFMQRLGALPLMAQPGEQRLCTTGSNVLDVLVARAAGRPLDVVLSERILAPLGMTDTAFHISPEKLDRFVTGYVAQDGRLMPFDPPEGMYLGAPAFPAGDSGLISTPADFGSFARFMTNGLAPDSRRLLSEASLAAMKTNRLTSAQREGGRVILGPGRGWGYGLGIMVEDSPHGVARGAGGWDGGFGTSWFNDPKHGLTAILLTHRLFDSPDPPQVHKDFWKAAHAALDASEPT
jgi:CubicO group peptidase (beta-lactamase class C family)